jgi:hypothetical protein
MVVPKSGGGRRWARLLLVALAAVVLRTGLQAVVPSGGTSLPPSSIVTAGLLPIAFLLYAFFGFALLGVVFAITETRLWWSKTKKGLAFGLSFAIMWAAYLLEPLPFNSGASLGVTLAYPFADGLALVILGLLLGRFLGTDSPGPGGLQGDRGALALATIAALFVAGRYVSYVAVGIISAYGSRPYDTMLWAAVTGLSIGLLYQLLGRGFSLRSPFANAVGFGVLVFGSDLFFFNFFVPLVNQTDLVDLLLRTVIDILSVTVGVFLVEETRSYGSRRSGLRPRA